MATKFITVHGTGDGVRDAKEPKWWQPESQFSRDLINQAGGGTVEPFMWDGKNDELSRREGAENLLWRLRDYEDRGDEVVLIGHSHGGSVIATALTFAMSTQREFSNIKSVITVGTPYIGMKRQRWFWDRLNFAGQLGFLYSLFLLVLTLIAIWTVVIFEFSAPDMAEMADQMSKTSPTDMTYDMQDVTVAEDEVDSAYVTIASSLFIIALTGFFLSRSQRRLRELHDKNIVARFHDAFSSRWLALYDQRDEAINGLKRVYDMKLKLLEPAQTQEALRLLLVFFAIFLVGSSVAAEQLFKIMDLAGGFFPDWKLMQNEGLKTFFDEHAQYSTPSDIHWTLYEFGKNRAFEVLIWYNQFVISTLELPNLVLDTASDEFGKSSFAVGFLADIISVLAKLAIVMVFFPISDLLNRFLLGRLFSAQMNGIFGNQIRQQALGNTTKGEDLTGVGRMPKGWTEDAEPLSEEASLALCNYAADHARDTLIKLQDVLADSMIAADQTLVDALTEQLSWNEMIHTAYFRVPESRAHIIDRTLQKSGLANKGGSTRLHQNDLPPALPAYQVLRRSAVPRPLSE